MGQFVIPKEKDRITEDFLISESELLRNRRTHVAPFAWNCPP